MDAEPRLSRALERSAATVEPDVPGALRDVRGRARRRTTLRRATVAAAVVGAVAAVGLTAQLLTSDPDRGGDPVRPPPEVTQIRVEVVGEVAAADLGLRKLLSVAVAPDGRVYVTDTSQQVAELTPDLDLVRAWGSSGERAGQFRLVQGSIAVGPDGSVYVSDTGNFRIQVFTPDGAYIRSLGEFGNGPGEFTWPFDLAVGPDGSVFVADDKEQTLAMLSPSGQQLWRRGGLAETDPRLQGHSHLAMVDPQGRAIVVNDDQGVVLLVGPDGEVAETLAGEGFTPGDICDATLDPAERLHLTACIPPWPLSVYDAGGARLGGIAEAGLVQSPRWAADGSGYAVTEEGGLVELRVTS